MDGVVVVGGEACLLGPRVVVTMLETTFSELLIVDESPLKNVVKKVKVVNMVLISNSSDPRDGARVGIGSEGSADLDGVIWAIVGVADAAFNVSVATRLFVISKVVNNVLSLTVYGIVCVVVVK